MQLLIRALVLALASTLLVLLSPSAAHAAPCLSKKQTRVDVWPHTTTWQSSFTDARGIRLTANTYYHFCPNGRRHNKVMPFTVNYCYTHTNGQPGGPGFDGVVFDVTYWDDNKTFSPWAITVPDDGTDQNCKSREISAETRKWLVLVHSAAWKADYKIKKVATPDTWKAFKWDNWVVKYFHPWNDIAIGGWHW